MPIKRPKNAKETAVHEGRKRERDSDTGDSYTQTPAERGRSQTT